MRNARIAVLFFLTLCLPNAVHPQSAELSRRAGVAKHDGVDAIYQRFSRAYRELDVDLVADQYAESAAYLVPDSEVMIGRAQIRSSFGPFFDSMRAGGQKLTISFDIIQRKIGKDIGYDVGIYTLRTFKNGKETGKGEGKFVVVAVKERDGRWRFQVDGYSGLKPERSK